ncbi:MAG: hypothetical protein NC313_13420 [Butyrivibrio sp.]|nr:hypothetical protein [Butyrivibrio sp.]
MRKRIKKQLETIVNRVNEHLSIKAYKIIEIIKFKDSRRKKIYSNVKLTKEQKRKIDRLFINNYGKRIPYTWHRHYTAFTGNFDEKYIPELLYIPEFEYYMTPHKEYCYAFADKNVISIIAGYIGVKTPKTILSGTAGIYRDENLQPLSFRMAVKRLVDAGGAMFVKPSIETGSGEGCHIINIDNGMDIVTGNSVEKTLADLGENFVIQELIKCHENIARLHPQSVNTFRVITYRWKSDIKHFPVIMRIGMGESYLDNAHAGGIFIAVDDDGALHKTAYTEFNQQYIRHPNTNILFEGYKVENIDKVIYAAEKMHYAIPQVGVVNWDFTLNEEGEPVLIEGNMRKGSIWLIEEAHGCGAFGNDTGMVLNWLRQMRTTKINKRNQINYGGLGINIADNKGW